MTNQDRDALLTLRQQQTDLQLALERLTRQLVALEARAGVTLTGLLLPPVPPEAFLPPLPVHRAEAALPPIPVPSEIQLPPLPPAGLAGEPRASSRPGAWLTGLGVTFCLVFVLLLAASVDAILHIHQRLGPGGRVGCLALASIAVATVAQRMERRREGRTIFSRTLLVLGLLGLYFSAYAAHFVPGLVAIPNSVVGGMFLLLWTGYVLILAERRRSQALGTFAIFLAFVAMAQIPVTDFSLGADLLLAATAATLLLRHGWATLAGVGVIGTYFALFRRLVFDSNGDLVLDTSRTLPFLPPAVYVAGAWTIFTAAIILAVAPSFRGGRRLTVVSLNNAGAAFVLALAAYIAGYGASAVGWSLLDTGLVLLVVSRLAGWAHADPVDLMAAYAAQGLALFTAGVIVVFTGVTRAFLLLLETLLLGIAGAFAGDRILTISTYVAGFFATVFAVWQVAIAAHHPWLLGLGGALIMLINAWSSRGEVRHSPVARSSVVVSTSCYCLLALCLIFAAFSTELTDASLPVALAVGALGLTFSIYYFSIYELPSLAQVLMLAALVLVLFPVETGEELPGSTIAWVGLATLVLVTWWSRQRLTKPGVWLAPLLYVYALALVYLAVLTVRPFLDAQDWMVVASLLSALFLAYGAAARVWPVAVAGQVLLLLALIHFFFPPQPEVYPWAWWAAAVPVLVTFSTARAAEAWLRLPPDSATSSRGVVRFLVTLYKSLALVGVIRWIFGVVPPPGQLAAFFFIGTLLLAQGVRNSDSLLGRAGLLLNALGMLLCLGHWHPLATALNGLAVLLFVLQIPLADTRGLVTRLESWTFLLAAVLTGWFFVSCWEWLSGPASHPRLALGWAVYGLGLLLASLLAGDRRLRVCGLVVLAATLLRILFVDLWSLSLAVRLLTLLFFMLLVIVTVAGLIWRYTSRPQRPENPPTNL